MKLFINAGGRGERLYPLTKDIPKPMLELCEKPMLHHLVDWAKEQDINEIIMMNGHLAEQIIDYFGDGEKFGISIVHSNEPYPLGSGGPIKLAEKHIDKTFAHISGDHICKVDLKKMLEFHQKNKAHITVLTHVSSHPEDSDILKIDENHKVIKFVSKHEDHTDAGNLGNAGLSIMEPEIMKLIDKESFTFETYLYPRILQEKNLKMMGYITDEFMMDIGTPERLKIVEEYLQIKWKKSS